MTGEDIILLVAGVLAPAALALHVFFGRGCVYPGWAKSTVVIVCLVTVIWVCLDWVAVNSESFHLSREVYVSLVVIRASLVGICLGIVLSIVLARPHKRTTTDKPRSTTIRATRPDMRLHLLANKVAPKPTRICQSSPPMMRSVVGRIIELIVRSAQEFGRSQQRQG